MLITTIILAVTWFLNKRSERNEEQREAEQRDNDSDVVQIREEVFNNDDEEERQQMEQQLQDQLADKNVRLEIQRSSQGRHGRRGN